MKKVNSKEMESVLALSGPARFEHFVKVVTDWQEVWGLYQDGWAQLVTNDGMIALPFWPAEAYAKACAVDGWSGYEPRSINLSEFLEVVLPKLKNEGAMPAVFLTPAGKGVTPTIDELIAALKTELQNYE